MKYASWLKQHPEYRGEMAWLKHNADIVIDAIESVEWSAPVLIASGTVIEFTPQSEPIAYVGADADRYLTARAASAAARALGSIKSERKAKASRANGLLGGRPHNLRGGRPRKR